MKRQHISIVALFALILCGFIAPQQAAATNEKPLNLPGDANFLAKKWNIAGIHNFRVGNYEIALDLFQRASGAAPKLGELHYNQALAFHMVDNHELAAWQFKLAERFGEDNQTVMTSDLGRKHIEKYIDTGRMGG